MKNLLAPFAVSILLISCISNSTNNETIANNSTTAIENHHSTIMNENPYENKKKPEETDTTFQVLLKKLELGENLSQGEFLALGVFFQSNCEEALSESIGLYLFNYFKGNRSRSDSLINFLERQEIFEKNDFLFDLSNVMCLEFQLEEYSLQRFINNFPIFRDSEPAIKAFLNCMETMIR